jgi:hypothetical protein
MREDFDTHNKIRGAKTILLRVPGPSSVHRSNSKACLGMTTGINYSHFHEIM